MAQAIIIIHIIHSKCRPLLRPTWVVPGAGSREPGLPACPLGWPGAVLGLEQA